jgi:hypothetical protein
MDSLLSSQAVDVKHVHKWLTHVAARLGVKKKLNITSIPAKVCPLSSIFTIFDDLQSQVPRQPNFVDCGAYCIHFFKRFIEDPRGVCQMIHVSAMILQGLGNLSYNKQVDLNTEQMDHLWATDNIPRMRKVLQKRLQGQALTNWVTK